MDLSVMICTWNNSRRLAITLDSISRCTIPDNLKWELVVVNNNCTDETDQVAQEFADKLPLVYVHEPQQGLSRARNAGLKASSGRLIAFTDDDVKPCAEWITAYWNAYQAKPTGSYFGGPVESEFEVSKVDEELLRLATAAISGLDWGRRARTLAPNEYFISANWACPAEALRASGGFDTRKGLDPSCGRVRTGEETDLMNRLEKIGLSPWYLPEARIVHFVPVHKCSLKYILARKEAGGFNDAGQYMDSRQGLIIGGIPRWMYRTAFDRWLRWVSGRLRGKKGYRELLDYRYIIGIMKGIHELSQAPSEDVVSTGTTGVHKE